MAIKKIKLPDGSIKQFKVPDDWSNEQTMEAAGNYFNLSKPQEKTESQPQPQQTNQNQSQQQQSTEQPQKQSAMQKFYDALGQGSAKQNIYRYGVADPLAGVSEIGQNIRKGLNNLNPFLFPNKPKDVDYSKSFGLPQQQNIGDQISRSVPDVAASVSVPEFKLGEAATSALSNAPKIGGYLKAILESKPSTQAISQGLYSAATAPDNKTQAGLTSAAMTAPASALSEALMSRNPALSKLGRLGLGTALGSALGYSGYKAGESLGFSPATAAAAGSALGFGIGMRGNPQTRIPLEISKEVEKFPDAAERIAASKRLGLPYITPLEATGSGILGALEGKLSVNPSKQAADILATQGTKRVGAESQSIQNLLDTIYKPAKTEQGISDISNLYNKSYYKKMPDNVSDVSPDFKSKYANKVPDDIFGLKDNKIFQQAKNLADTNPIYQESLKGVPENSVEYLDQIKKIMGDMQNSQGFGTHEANTIKKTQDKLVQGLDSFSSNYKDARGLAERQIARRDIEDWFDKRKQTGASMSQLLKSKEGMDDLQMHLRNVPEAQQQLKDMKMVFENLGQPLTGKGISTMYGNSMKEARSGGQYFSKLMDNVLYSNDKILANLITNPDWANELKRMSKITDKEKLAGALMNTFGKIGAQETAKQKQK